MYAGLCGLHSPSRSRVLVAQEMRTAPDFVTWEKAAIKLDKLEVCPSHALCFLFSFSNAGQSSLEEHA